MRTLWTILTVASLSVYVIGCSEGTDTKSTGDAAPAATANGDTAAPEDQSEPAEGEDKGEVAAGSNDKSKE